MNSPFKANPKDFVASTKEAFEVGQSSGSPAPEKQQSQGQSELGLEAGDNAIEQAQPASQKAALMKADQAALAQNKKKEQFMALWGDLDSMDWKKIPPHKMAMLLTMIPRKTKKDEPPYYLSYDQALIFSVEGYRMDLSPLSDQCFFVPDTWKVNATLAGKKYMARQLGMNFGPPKFERMEKPFERGKTVPGFKQDLGYKCSMQIKGFDDRAEYTAWLSEWYMPYSPVWKEKPEHMLQTRAQEKAISSASGVGASEMPHMNDIEPPIVGTPDIPSFTQEDKV